MVPKQFWKPSANKYQNVCIFFDNVTVNRRRGLLKKRLQYTANYCTVEKRSFNLFFPPLAKKGRAAEEEAKHVARPKSRVALRATSFAVAVAQNGYLDSNSNVAPAQQRNCCCQLINTLLYTTTPLAILIIRGKRVSNWYIPPKKSVRLKKSARLIILVLVWDTRVFD